MKITTVISWVMLALMFQPVLAQSTVPDSLLRTVLENNLQLKTAREAYHLALFAAGTGITPPDPEVEFGYLFGKPSEMGNRVDFSISQQVDFPSAYVHRSRVKDIEMTRAELDYMITRQEILHSFIHLWLERLYLNQMESLLSTRLDQAKRVNSSFRQKLETGEVGQLELSQSTLQFVAIENEYDKVQALLKTNGLALKEMAGGVELNISDLYFPPSALINPDSLKEAYNQGPVLQLYRQQIEKKVAQKKLSVSEGLPKISAGYYSESVLDQNFKGFQVGITVPLWENANRIKHAKSDVLLAEAETNSYTFQQQKELDEKLAQLASLSERAERLEAALVQVNQIEVLELALHAGEISQTEYFYASDLYFRNQQLLLEYKRDQLVKEAELLKIYL
jgi:outer membrane protein TolC